MLTKRKFLDGMKLSELTKTVSCRLLYNDRDTDVITLKWIFSAS
jgi:hypothetical protein